MRLVLVAVLGFLMLVGCATVDEPDRQDDSATFPELTRETSSAPTKKPSRKPSAATPTPTPTESPSATAAPKSEVQRASCVLSGRSTPKVTLSEADEGLMLVFEGQKVPPTGEAFYSATVFDAEGETGVQLGVAYEGGTQSAYFVFDFTEMMQENLGSEAVLSGDTLRARFDWSAMPALEDARPASWSAAFSLNGRDIGVCPKDQMESLPFPD